MLWLSSPHKHMLANLRLASGTAIQVQSSRHGFSVPDRIARPCGVQAPKKSLSSEGELRSLCDHGQLDSALEVLLRMDQQGRVPSVNVYRSFLKACAKRKALAVAKQVHAHLMEHGMESFLVLCEDVVNTLVKCGALNDALDVFWRLPHRNVFCWTAVITGFTNAGQAQQALKMYQQMLEEGVQPDTYTFVAIIKASGSIADLEAGKRIHAQAVKCRCESDLFVKTCLVDMYAKCGSIVDAQEVFDGLSQRDVVSWNTMLAACVEQGQAEKAFQLYEQMQEDGVKPSNRTFVSLLQACGVLAGKEQGIVVDGRCTKVLSLRRGEALHAAAQKKGYSKDVFVGSSLVSMYGKCGSITDAQIVFDTLPQRDLVTWNSMLAACIEQSEPEKALQLYKRMWKENVIPDPRTFVITLQACGMLADWKYPDMPDERSTKVKSLAKVVEIHGDARRTGHDSHVFVGNALVSMYGKCGSIVDAQNVFDQLSKRDLVTWNAMIAAYVEQGEDPKKALQLYKCMLEGGVSPDNRTFVSALHACCMVSDMEDGFTEDGRSITLQYLKKGIAIHADAQKKGSHTDEFVGSALVSMYGRFGCISEAQTVFNGLSQRDVVSWNAMLSAYLEQGHPEKALELYELFGEEGLNPDSRTFVSTLQAIGQLAENENPVVVDGQFTKLRCLKIGHKVHADAQKFGNDTNAFVGSTLVSMYGKCGSIIDAESVFNGLSHHDEVTWTAMLTAYVGQGQGDKALQLYRRMQEEGVSRSEITIVCVLQACSKTGSLSIIRQIHNTFVLEGVVLSSIMASTLITAYGRCASLVEARSVFDALPQPNVVSWNALIAAYSQQGNFGASLDCYEKMQLAGSNPDGVTFLLLLFTCSSVGSVHKGAEYFESMSRDYGITPELAHFVSMIDLLGRAGCFTRVEDLMSTMPVQPDLAMWLCVLSACRKHGHLLLAERAYNQAVCLQPEHPAAYLLMSNIYADAGHSDHARKVEDMRQMQGAWKKPGQSWIELKQEMHSFLVGDCSQPQQEQLYDVLMRASLELKNAWYEIKRDGTVSAGGEALCHLEMPAVAFAGGL